MSAKKGVRHQTLRALAVFAERRTAVMLALGFAAGLPNLLIFDTLSAWLRDDGMSLEIIAFFSLATLVYSFKFLWAPIIDRAAIPVLTAKLGYRRSWMLVTQGAIMLGLLAIATVDPRTHLMAVALFAVFTGFASATQDIVIDAWRIEAADMTRQGAMAAAYQWGYRIAMIVAGAVPLILADHYGWNLSYGLMAFLMAVGIAAVLAAPQEEKHTVRTIPVADMKAAPRKEIAEWGLRLLLILFGALCLGSGLSGNATFMADIVQTMGFDKAATGLQTAWTAPNGIWLQLVGVLLGFAVIAGSAWPIPGIRTRPGVYLAHALGDPLKDFFSRFGKTAFLILALICLYRLSDFVLNIMTPFYLDLGFTKTQIAEVRKIFGVPMSMIGIFLGGWSIARYGIMRPLIVGAFAVPLTNAIYSWLATVGADMPSLFFTIGVENICSAYAGTCLIAYMSGLTSAGFTATQYALFSSLYSLPGKLIGSLSGRIVESTAHAAEPGGTLDFLRGFFIHTPPTAYAEAMAKSHVDPHALGVGYFVFFLYSVAVGIAGMVLAIWVARRGKTLN